MTAVERQRRRPDRGHRDQHDGQRGIRGGSTSDLPHGQGQRQSARAVQERSRQPGDQRQQPQPQQRQPAQDQRRAEHVKRVAQAAVARLLLDLVRQRSG